MLGRGVGRFLVSTCTWGGENSWEMPPGAKKPLVLRGGRKVKFLAQSAPWAGLIGTRQEEGVCPKLRLSPCKSSVG